MSIVTPLSGFHFCAAAEVRYSRATPQLSLGLEAASMKPRTICSGSMPLDGPCGR